MSVLVWTGVVIIGGFGSVLRFVVDRAVGGWLARTFPYGTFVVNISGAAVLGLSSGLALGHDAALLAGTALIGAYTTFSTWILETHRLSEERLLATAAANIVGSVVFGVAAAWLGQWIGEQL